MKTECLVSVLQVRDKESTTLKTYFLHAPTAGNNFTTISLIEVQLVFMIFRKQPFYSSTHYSWLPSRDCVLLQMPNSFNRFSKILQQNDLEKTTKSPMNIITGLSADILIWLSAERYFNKQTYTGCVSII